MGRMMQVSGAKKGGGTGAAEAPDNLRSTQIAEVAILISEGECAGLVNGLKSVYLDGVPIENADGSRNFEDVSFAYTTGTQGQAALPGLSSVDAEIPVAIQVDQASPVTRTITDPSVDHVRVTIGVPQLTEADTTTGALNGSSFEFAIEIQSAGGGFVERHRNVVSGKTTSRYTRAVRLPLTGSAPWDIRVKRISPEPASSAISNRFAWDSYTTVRTAKLRYPHSAVAMLRVNAKVFHRVPVASFDWGGIIAKVPTNYDPIARTYSGSWDGTFKLAWTNNPAWLTYLVVTHERFGLGRLVPAAMSNKWALYQIGQYCDQAVPDGWGGTEPRFTCNAYIQTRREAYQFLQQMASVWRGMLFWASSSVEYAQDAPGEAEMLYTPANVLEDGFQYADASEKQRHTVFIVKWTDLAQGAKEVPEVFVDADAVARYGMRELTLEAFGCTSRGQAARVARWAAYTEEHEGEAITFGVGPEGVVAKPGKVFKVADPNESGVRLGGRIRSATTTTVTLDSAVTLVAGEAYALSVLQPDASAPEQFRAQKRTVTTGSGSAQTLTVSPAFSVAPVAETVWLLESTGLEATWWRCLAVEELGGNSYRVSGLRHHPGKFSLVEQGLALDARPISRLTLFPPAVASVAIAETVYLAGTVSRSRVTVSWPEPARGLNYLVSWRYGEGSWGDLPPTSANSVDVDGLLPGEVFEATVKAINAFGNGSAIASATLLLLGKVAKPPTPSGFTASVVEGGVEFRWSPDTAADYLTHELRVGASWDAGTTIFEGAASRWLWPMPALGSYTAWLKAFDTSLGQSVTAASAAFVVTDAIYAQWLTVAGIPANLDSLVGPESILNNEDAVIRSPGGGVLTTLAATVTGALKIRLPQAFTNTMMRFVVDIYEYGGGLSCSLEIAGYNQDTGSWQQVTARVTGDSNVEYPVRFGHDTQRACVWVGNAGDTWAYPQVRVRDWFGGYTNFARHQWETGWTLSFDPAGPLNVSQSVLDTLPGARWNKVMGDGRPADNATVGATWGVNVNAIPANLASLVGPESIRNNEDSIIRSPGGGVYTTLASPVTGALKVRLPQPFTQTMMRFTIDIFEYGTGLSCSIDVAGFTADSTNWMQVTARVSGDSTVEYPVRFGHDTVKACVWVGDPTDTWAYPQVRVRDWFGGYTNFSRAQWESGWQLTFDTSPAANVSATVLDTLPGARWNKLSLVPANLASLVGPESIRNNEDSIVRSPGGGVFITQTPSITGALKVRLPMGFSATMMRFFVDIYEYGTGLSCSIEICGYTYIDTAAWLNCTARVVGEATVEYPVRFGHDGLKACVWIGNAGDTWSFPQVRIRDWFGGYANFGRAQWESGWQITFDGGGATNVTATVLDTLPGARLDKATGVVVTGQIDPGAVSLNVNAQVQDSASGTSWPDSAASLVVTLAPDASISTADCLYLQVRSDLQLSVITTSTAVASILAQAELWEVTAAGAFVATIDQATLAGPVVHLGTTGGQDGHADQRTYSCPFALFGRIEGSGATRYFRSRVTLWALNASGQVVSPGPTVTVPGGAVPARAWVSGRTDLDIRKR